MGTSMALQALMAAEEPALVFLPHTYQTRDFAPALAARLGRALVTDVTAVEEGWRRHCLRASSVPGQAECGRDRLRTRAAPRDNADWRVPRGLGCARRASAAPVRKADVTIDPAKIRQKPEAPFKEARQAVDLSQAERIVAVGRGIKGQEHLKIAEELARVMGAEIAASRPICDAGWLPMDRQIGSSGQTVAPKLYVALGISGAIQHLVGMKGSRTIVAINKDPEAPIFEIADYGITGDLFEVVPAIIAELQK